MPGSKKLSRALLGCKSTHNSCRQQWVASSPQQVQTCDMPGSKKLSRAMLGCRSSHTSCRLQ